MIMANFNNGHLQVAEVATITTGPFKQHQPELSMTCVGCNRALLYDLEVVVIQCLAPDMRQKEQRTSNLNTPSSSSTTTTASTSSTQVCVVCVCVEARVRTWVSLHVNQIILIK
jgi:hypothetical protein